MTQTYQFKEHIFKHAGEQELSLEFDFFNVAKTTPEAQFRYLWSRDAEKIAFVPDFVTSKRGRGF